jgi:fermentation-respiration switch protein FrsA (DUF1100 family)
MTDELYEATNHAPLKQKHIVKNGGHNDTWRVGGIQYLRKINQFMNEARETPRIAPV